MFKKFGKKIDNATLLENYFLHCSKKNIHKSDTNESTPDHFYVYPPTHSTTFSLAHLQSLLFVDVLSKRHEQINDNHFSYKSISLDPLYSEGVGKSLVEQTRDVVATMNALGINSNQDKHDVALIDFVSRTLSDLYKKNSVTYTSDVRYWSIQGQTVISDSQLITETIRVKRMFVKFFIDMKKHTIVASIDDPIYLFGVSAIAVNPLDKRYKKFVGKNVIVPIINKQVPVIADERVDMTKDYGAMLLIPAHNREHLTIASDHEVACDSLAVDANGNFTSLAGEFAGKNAYDFRDNIMQYLLDISNLDEVVDVDLIVYKDKYNPEHILLPLITKQRFFDAVSQHLTDTMKVYLDSMESPDMHQKFFESEPMCISKQLPGSFRFPAIVNQSGDIDFIDSHTFASFVASEKTAEQNGVLSHIVLLLILSGNLDETFSFHDFVEFMHQENKDYGYMFAAYFSYLQEYYVNEKDLMATLTSFVDCMHKSLEDASLYDSVAMMLESSQGISFCEEEGNFTFDLQSLGFGESIKMVPHNISSGFLSALKYFREAPFSQPKTCIMGLPNSLTYWSKYCYSSDVVQAYDSSLHVFEKDSTILFSNKELNKQLSEWSSDVVRACIIVGSYSQNGEVAVGSAELYQRFVNKFWNSARYIYQTHLGEKKNTISLESLNDSLSSVSLELNDFDVWIMLKLNHIIEEVHYYLERKDVSKVLSLLTKFAWYDFSDSYLEVTKEEVSLHGKKVLLYCIGTLLQLLYPLFPFFTTSLWEHFGYEGYISVNAFLKPVNGIEKNYKFSMLMDLVAKWNHLHASNRAMHLYDDMNICLKANRDFIEFAKQYESLVCKMTDAEQLTFISQEESLGHQWFTDSLIDITVGVSYVSKQTPLQNIHALEHALNDKQQMLQNMRSIVLTLQHGTPVYQDYVSKIDAIKDEIQSLELDISRMKYS